MAKTNGRTKKANIEKTLEKILEKAINPPPAKERKPVAVKSLYWEFILYPDNPRHLEYLYDIKHGKFPFATGCLHDKDVIDETPAEETPAEETPAEETPAEETPAEETPDLASLKARLKSKHPVVTLPEKVKKTIQLKPVQTEYKYKKAHAHIIIKLPYQGTKGSVERLFPNLESHLIKVVDCADERYRYLIHLDSPQKHRYSPNEVFGNTEMFYLYYHHETQEYEGAEICRILDILDNWDYEQGKPTYSKVIRICCEMGLYGYLRQGGALLSQVIRETIDEYIKETADSRWLDEHYIQEKQADEIWKLNSALKSANNTIEIYKKLVK